MSFLLFSTIALNDIDSIFLDIISTPIDIITFHNIISWHHQTSIHSTTHAVAGFKILHITFILLFSCLSRDRLNFSVFVSVFSYDETSV